ncbi:MFS transporter [Sulfurisoma sediminicola]|uniref:Putative MFS family arabinose efflux permease n=1 Tax=Sulfurisoma sediminicola TaxID=1381557 RepID=A0A497XEQ9_9PROT|nr:MFS transporter [Sulfurisoma sediminicola]RLJ65025.1 putative MFS family arabinose efflux permease [Sulfurisoma sediminicola]
MSDPALPLPPERERLLLLTLAGIQLAHIVDFMVMMPLGPILMRELGVGTHEFGLLVSAYTFTAAASGVLVASFIDRFERKRLLLAMLALFALATLSCALAPDFASLLFARGAAGAFGGVLGAMVQTMVGDLVPFERRGRASGTIMAAFSLSTIAGVPLSLWLANHFGWRFPFLLVGVLAAVFLALAWRLLPRLRGHLVAAGERAHPLAAMAAVLRDANHLRALGFLALVVFASFMVIPYITIVLVGNVGVAQADIPLVYLCGGVASLLSARWIGRRADRHGKVRVYRVVAAGSILPLLLITHLTAVPLGAVLVVTTLFFILVPGRMVPAMAIVTSAAQPALRGTFLAINAAVLQLASGIAAVVGGLIIATDAAGTITRYDWSGYLATGVTLLAIAAVGRVKMR